MVQSTHNTHKMYITRIYIYSYKWIEDRSPSLSEQKKNQTKNQQKIYYFEFTFQKRRYLTKRYPKYNNGNRKN